MPPRRRRHHLGVPAGLVVCAAVLAATAPALPAPPLDGDGLTAWAERLGPAAAALALARLVVVLVLARLVLATGLALAARACHGRAVGAGLTTVAVALAGRATRRWVRQVAGASLAAATLVPGTAGAAPPDTATTSASSTTTVPVLVLVDEPPPVPTWPEPRVPARRGSGSSATHRGAAAPTPGPPTAVVDDDVPRFERVDLPAGERTGADHSAPPAPPTGTTVPGRPLGHRRDGAAPAPGVGADPVARPGGASADAARTDGRLRGPIEPSTRDGLARPGEGRPRTDPGSTRPGEGRPRSDPGSTRPADGSPAPTAAPTHAGAAQPGHAPAPLADWVVEPGQHLWHVAEATARRQAAGPVDVRAVAGYHRRLIAANRHRLPVPDDPDLVLPGTVLVRPPWAP